MYIEGYMMIYHRYIYMADLSLSFSVLYLVMLKMVSDFKENFVVQEESDYPREIISFYKDLILDIAISIVFIVLIVYCSMKWTLGGSRIILSFFTGYAAFNLYNSMNTIAGSSKNVTQSSDEAVENNANENGSVMSESSDLENNSRAKNSLLVLSSFFILIPAMYFSMVNFVRSYDDAPRYYIVNWHNFLELNIPGLLLFSGIVFILNYMGVFTKALNWIRNQVINKKEPSLKNFYVFGMIFTVSFEIILVALLILSFSGISPFYSEFRYSVLLVPWFFTFFILWLFTYMIERKDVSIGFLGAIFFLGSISIWGGAALGLSPDDSYIPAIWWGLLIIPIIFFNLVYVYNFVVELKKVAGRRTEASKRDLTKEDKGVDNDSNRNNTSSWASKISRVSRLSSTKAKQLVKTLLIVVIIIVPMVLVIVPSRSATNYQLLANVDNNTIFYLVDPTSRVSPDYLPNFGLSSYSNPNNTIEIYGARGEHESVQIVMRPINQEFAALYGIEFTGFNLTQSDGLNHSGGFATYIPANETTFRAYENKYPSVLGNKIPDLLENFSRISINDGKNHPLWFTFYIPRDVEAGVYEGDLTFEIADINKPLEGIYPHKNINFKVKLNVFNFTLPKIPTLKSNFGFYTSRPEFDQIMQEFKEHRMMHWAFFNLPRVELYDNGSIKPINFTAMDNQIQEIYDYGTYTIGFSFEPSYILPNSPFMVEGKTYDKYNYTTQANKSIVDRTYKEFFSQLEQHLKLPSHSYIDDFGNNRTWFDDIYLNGNDEIESHPEDEMNAILEKYRWLKQDINISFPIMQTMMDPKQNTAKILENIDIICWHTQGHEISFVTQWKEENKEVWIYTTGGPRFPNPSVSTNEMAVQYRALGWQCYIYNYTHYLIWDTATPYDGDAGYGYQGCNGGTILYKVAGGYALTPRMELIRDGFEDHDYFALLNYIIKKLKQQDPQDPQIKVGEDLLNNIFNLMDEYAPDMNYLYYNQLRIDIGNFISVNSGLL
ncbi:MAG: hypothetical protein ACTSU2_05510 [Promethearchaeota archaeon]